MSLERLYVRARNSRVAVGCETKRVVGSSGDTILLHDGTESSPESVILSATPDGLTRSEVLDSLCDILADVESQVKSILPRRSAHIVYDGFTLSPVPSIRFYDAMLGIKAFIPVGFVRSLLASPFHPVKGFFFTCEHNSDYRSKVFIAEKIGAEQFRSCDLGGTLRFLRDRGREKKWLEIAANQITGSPASRFITSDGWVCFTAQHPLVSVANCIMVSEAIMQTA